MAYAAHTRLTMGGTLGGTPSLFADAPEIWSCTINGETTGPITQARVDAAWDSAATFIGAVCSSAVHLTYLKMAVTDATNHIPGEVLRHDGLESGTGSVAYPYQVACAVTLRTAIRGPGGRGRFYIPLPDASMHMADGTFADSDRDDIAEAAQTFLHSLIAVDNADLGAIIVASQRHGNVTVTDIQVGNVPDTQRRRRNALVEDYGDLLPVNEP